MFLSNWLLPLTNGGWFGGRVNIQMAILCSIYPWAIMCNWGYGFETTGIFSLIVGMLAISEVVTMCRFPKNQTYLAYRIGWSISFLAYILAAAVATTYIRHDSGGPFLLWMTVVIIATDIGAITVGKFAGKILGHKPKPVSKKWLGEGKTWPGSIGGIIIGSFIGWISGEILVNFWDIDTIEISPPVALVCSAAICGDILESFFKRQLDWKDSSRLLGGHGRFLDRFDGYFSTMIFSAIWLYS